MHASEAVDLLLLPGNGLSLAQYMPTLTELKLERVTFWLIILIVLFQDLHSTNLEDA